ncbi:unnamed protein product [Rotaria socialis]|uniref:Isopenicillin N synthase-like Fe(2+) 2OG dioxygenase domain-containing protein n=1 Tax=Rotaria socialis TaxID=392032 RepID=A0A817RW47_9BILA|nr:unnamed protein product [Rotaria socialis]CAF3281444.1 unnamed protein product [Rotaria socialis]CAF3609620.1 unnamed protein product [Rotaria socialis]CAF4419943.1 unnamed protein product [Rotaria socialis]CAF4480848.1 unnamed protein product [Rotaria socialis]
MDRKIKYTVDLSPYLQYSTNEALKQVGCQPIMFPISKAIVDSIYVASDTCMIAHFDKVCKLAQDWEYGFAASDESIPWCNVRFGIRDKRPAVERKKDKKFYLQFCREYGEWVEKNRAHELASIPELKNLFDLLLTFEKECQQVFLEKLKEIAAIYPEANKLLYNYRGEQRVPISIRVITYENEDHFSVSPHFDKAAMTILMPSDDNPDEECLIVAPADGTIFDPEKLRRVVRPLYNDSNSTSCALFITGAMLQEIGVPVPPTPHAVLPHNRVLRHVLVAFCNIPYLDTKHLTFNIVYKKEMPNNFIERFKPI